MELRFTKQLNITYSIKMEKVAENIGLLLAVLQQLKEDQVQGVKYTVHLMGENVFIHTVQFANEGAGKLFNGLVSFQEFRRHLAGRLLERPITNTVVEIGGYAAKDIASS